MGNVIRITLVKGSGDTKSVYVKEMRTKLRSCPEILAEVARLW